MRPSSARSRPSSSRPCSSASSICGVSWWWSRKLARPSTGTPSAAPHRAAFLCRPCSASLFREFIAGSRCRILERSSFHRALQPPLAGRLLFGSIPIFALRLAGQICTRLAAHSVRSWRRSRCFRVTSPWTLGPPLTGRLLCARLCDRIAAPRTPGGRARWRSVPDGQGLGERSASPAEQFHLNGR